MSVPAAYLGVILIWTTTPLAIKWSSEGSHFLFGVTVRMAIGAVICLALLRWRRLPLPRDRRSWLACLACGLGIYVTMTCSYWASQYIPSGWIAVVFGLTPVLTGAMAALWLQERLAPARLAGMVLGMAGLLAIYGEGMALGPRASWGIGAILLAATAQSASAVWVKRLGGGVPVLTMTATGVTLAALLDAVTWAVSGSGWPALITARALLCTLYLGIGGSVAGFLLYYYVLKRVEATRVALITLVTPVSALLLGQALNNEVLSRSVIGGTAAILAGLLLFQWGDRRRRPQTAAKESPRGG